MSRGGQAPVTTSASRASSRSAARVSSPLELAGFEPRATGGSDRGFGAFFAVVFAAIGVFPLTVGGQPRTWALATAGLLLATAIARPRWLSPLNRVWVRLGWVLHRVVSPVVVTAIYFGTVTPTGLVLRLLKKDVLRLKREPRVDSYWIARDPPGPSRESFTRPY